MNEMRDKNMFMFITSILIHFKNVKEALTGYSVG